MIYVLILKNDNIFLFPATCACTSDIEYLWNDWTDVGDIYDILPSYNIGYSNTETVHNPGPWITDVHNGFLTNDNGGDSNHTTQCQCASGANGYDGLPVGSYIGYNEFGTFIADVDDSSIGFIFFHA